MSPSNGKIVNVKSYNPIDSLVFESPTAKRDVLAQSKKAFQTGYLGNYDAAFAASHQDELRTHFKARTLVKYINPTIGYGLFAAEDLPHNAYVMEYAGLVRRRRRIFCNRNAYCFVYPTGSWHFRVYMIDSLAQGNESRFLNHSFTPSLQPLCMQLDGIIHIVFRTLHTVYAGEELTFHYGPGTRV